MLAGAILDQLLESLDQFLQVLFGQIDIFFDADFVLEMVHDFIDRFVFVFMALLHTHDHVAVHLQKRR